MGHGKRVSIARVPVNLQSVGGVPPPTLEERGRNVVLVLFWVERKKGLIPRCSHFTHTTAGIFNIFLETSLFSGILELHIQNFLF